MAMGKRKGRQTDLWVATQDLARAPGHPFFNRLNRLLDEHGFDRFVDGFDFKSNSRCCCRAFLFGLRIQFEDQSIEFGAVVFGAFAVGVAREVETERGVEVRGAIDVG